MDVPLYKYLEGTCPPCPIGIDAPVINERMKIISLANKHLDNQQQKNGQLMLGLVTLDISSCSIIYAVANK